MAQKLLSLEEIGQESYDSWGGKEGEERRAKVLGLLSEELPRYASLLGYSEKEILMAWEKARNVNCVNWYQKANFPDLGEVIVLDSLQQFQEKFPSHKSTCPMCGGLSTDYYACNSGKEVVLDGKKTTVCNWKVYGLFRDMGKGVSLLIKEAFLDHPVPERIFKPIELQ